MSLFNSIVAVVIPVTLSQVAIVTNEKVLKQNDDPWIVFLVYSLGELIVSCPFTVHGLIKRPTQTVKTPTKESLPSPFFRRPILLALLCIIQLLNIFTYKFVHQPYTLSIAKAICPGALFWLLPASLANSKVGLSALMMYMASCIAVCFIHGIAEFVLILVFTCLYSTRLYLLRHLLVSLNMDLWLSVSVVSALSSFLALSLIATFGLGDLATIGHFGSKSLLLLRGIAFSTMATVYLMKLIQQVGAVAASFFYPISEFLFLLLFHWDTTSQPSQMLIWGICLVAATTSLFVVTPTEETSDRKD
jgi:hypothetical protein